MKFICWAGTWAAIGMMTAAALTRGAELDKLTPDDAEMVLTINVTHILESPLAQKHLDDIKAAIPMREEVVQLFDSFGFDPLKDVATITSAMAGGDNPDKSLVILHGRFDVTKIEGKAAEIARKDEGQLKIHRLDAGKMYEVTVSDGETAQTTFISVLDQGTVVVSPDKDYVLEAAAKHIGTRTGKVNKDLRDVVEKINGARSFWAAALSSALIKGPLAADEKTREVLATFDSVTAGISVDKAIKAEVVISAKDVDAAKTLSRELTDALDQAKAVLVAVVGKNQEVVDILDSLKIAVDGKSVVLRGEVSDELIDRSIKK